MAANSREAETEAEGEVYGSREVELDHQEPQGNRQQAAAGENRPGQSPESQQKWVHVTECNEGMQRTVWFACMRSHLLLADLL
jgi:hypothetical protein